MRAVNREAHLQGCRGRRQSEADEALPFEQKAVLEGLPLCNLNLADRVLVVNPDGYVDESTCRDRLPPCGGQAGRLHRSPLTTRALFTAGSRRPPAM